MNDRFKKINLYIDIIKTSTPVILSFMVNYIQVFTDQAFLGNYHTHALVAINNAAFPYFMVANTSFAIGNAIAILIARFIGSNKAEKAGKLLETSYLCSIGLTLPFFLLFFFGGGTILSILGCKEPIHTHATNYLTILSFNYLIYTIIVPTASAFQGMGNNLPNLVGEVIRVVLNVLLNRLLIFGFLIFPEMGIKGAAFATVISTLVGGIINLLILLNYKRYFSLSIKGIFKPAFSLYKKVLKLGIPIAAEYNTNNFIPIIIIFILNKKNPLFAGVYGIWNTLLWFSYYFNIGIGIASYSLIGKATGAGAWKKAREITHRLRVYSQAWALIIATVYLLFPTQILGLFSKDKNILGLAMQMGLVALLLFPRAFGQLNAFSLKGYGKSLIVLIIQLSGLITIPLCLYIFLIKMNMGVSGVLWAILVDECLKSIINLIILEKLTKRKVCEA